MSRDAVSEKILVQRGWIASVVGLLADAAEATEVRTNTKIKIPDVIRFFMLLVTPDISLREVLCNRRHNNAEDATQIFYCEASPTNSTALASSRMRE